MKLNEIFPLESLTPSNGIFAHFRKLYPNQFELFFDKLTPLPLDMWFISTYGERTVTKLMENVANDSSSQEGAFLVIFSIHMQSWQKTYDALFTENGAFDNYVLVETHTGTTKGNSKQQSESVDSVQSFNDTTYKDTDKNVNNNNTENEQTQDITITKKGNIGNTVNSDLITRQIWAYRSKLMQIIFADIRDYITLQIYE